MITSFYHWKQIGYAAGMSDPAPAEPFFLIITDPDQSLFCVEGPMTDDHPWRNGVRFINERRYGRITCGPAGPDRDALSAEFQATSKYGGCPPGSIVRPRP